MPVHLRCVFKLLLWNQSLIGKRIPLRHNIASSALKTFLRSVRHIRIDYQTSRPSSIRWTYKQQHDQQSEYQLRIEHNQYSKQGFPGHTISDDDQHQTVRWFLKSRSWDPPLQSIPIKLTFLPLKASRPSLIHERSSHSSVQPWVRITTFSPLLNLEVLGLCQLIFVSVYLEFDNLKIGFTVEIADGIRAEFSYQSGHGGRDTLNVTIRAVF